MKYVLTLCIAALLVCCTIGASVSPSIVTTDEHQNQGISEFRTMQQTGKASSSAYTGRLRVYVVEPVSRWNNYAGQPYHFGFLGFAFNSDISIDPQDTYQNTMTWNGDVSEGNAMVIAAVFNSESHQGFAYPPSSNPFTAHYTDATAAAAPGQTGYNSVTWNFTHTVLVEEATATWCQYCPAMAETLYAIYETGAYPWYFVALVDDMNSQAASRLRSEYNIYGFPTAFFDGGYQVYVGGSTVQSNYRTRIINCGKRVVPDLNLSVSVTYMGAGSLQIQVNIKNNAPPNYPPATPSAPSGETNGTSGVEYTYTASTTDPNGDDVYYWFNWGDGSNSGWVGPYHSGQAGHASHAWSNAGIYEVTVQAKDTSGEQSSLSPLLSVKMGTAIVGVELTAGLAKSMIGGTVKNAGTVALTDIDWNITVKGGLFGFINILSNGTIDTLAINEQVSVKTDKSIFGLGKVSIKITAKTIAGDTSKTATGFVFGPFISIK